MTHKFGMVAGSRFEDATAGDEGSIPLPSRCQRQPRFQPSLRKLDRDIIKEQTLGVGLFFSVWNLEVGVTGIGSF